jgi:charged multivesicular body protein 7
MIDLADFTAADKSIYARAWIPSPWAILKWSLRTAGLTGHGSYDKSGNLKKGDLVLVPVLEDISKKLLAWQQRQGQSPTDRIYTRESFSTVVASLLASSQEASLLNSKDLDILLLYLSRDKPMLSYDEKTVKLMPLGATRPEPVTSEDNAVANLKSLIASLTAQTEALETNITTQQQRATTAVSAKNKTAALAALRSKKSAERALAQRSATLQQLEDVFTQIQQASDQIQVVETLRTSASALKSLNKKVGSVESVDAVLDDLREEMQKTGEVQSILAEPLTGDAAGAEIADAEVDEELEAMEREERKREDERKAKETAARLQELEEAERKGKEQQQKKKEGVKDGEREGPTDEEIQALLSKSTEDMRKMSLTADRELSEKKQVPEAA